MLRVGLTGGIGAGKSAVATRLATQGAIIIDSDRIAREVVDPGTEGLAEIVVAFGPRVLREDGSLDRPALGAVVFGDEAARRRLEGIIHPRVRARTAELVAAAPHDAIVVNDVPLLVEVGLAPTYHLVVVVQVAQATRVDRLVRNRGMTVEEAYQRIQAQVSDEERGAAADVLLTNDGSLAELHDAVDTLWHDRLVPYERNLRARRVSPLDPDVTVVEPDESWPAQFSRLAARIQHAIGPMEHRIDHIGATSVAGLPAEDVIDIQLGVESMTQADALVEALAAAGFPPSGAAARVEQDGGERWHGSADPGRPVRLWVRVTGSPRWRWALLWRDYLRAEGEPRDRCAAFIRELAQRSPDRDSFLAGEERWMEKKETRARQWGAATG